MRFEALQKAKWVTKAARTILVCQNLQIIIQHSIVNDCWYFNVYVTYLLAKYGLRRWVFLPWSFAECQIWDFLLMFSRGWCFFKWHQSVLCILLRWVASLKQIHCTNTLSSLHRECQISTESLAELRILISQTSVKARAVHASCVRASPCVHNGWNLFNFSGLWGNGEDCKPENRKSAFDI